jgi:hypothetical protein
MDFEINGLDEITGIFRELSLENQFRLLECSQISQIAENAVKKAFPDGQVHGSLSGGDWTRAIPPGRGVCSER